MHLYSFNVPTTTEIYTLSLHDALPIWPGSNVARDYFYYPGDGFGFGYGFAVRTEPGEAKPPAPDSKNRDRKSTRLNSSHMSISYAVFCLKKKTNYKQQI